MSIRVTISFSRPEEVFPPECDPKFLSEFSRWLAMSLLSFGLGMSRGVDAEGHQETAAQENERVHAAHDDVHVAAGFFKRVGVKVEVDEERSQDAAEEHGFGDEKDPHPENGRVSSVLDHFSGGGRC